MQPVARLAGAEPPSDRRIDGADIGPLLRETSGAGSSHEALFYYSGSALDAVRAGRWKLFVGRRGRGSDAGETGLCELYDLEEDLGDAAVGIADTGCRPVGCVPNPRPLATFDPSHPYFTAMYDRDEAG